METRKNTKKQRERKKQNIQIGKRCQQARKALDYTQEQLAEKIGVSTQFLSDAERGVTGMSVDTILKLCDILAITPNFILSGTENESSTENSLSIYSQMRNLPPQKQEILEEIMKLLIKAYFTD